MENIKVEIVADSVNLQGDRLTSMVLTYPRMIHAELLTHRAFSRNANSSRAVPVKKMIESVKNNTFCPIEFQKAHKGMQGSEYFVGSDKQECVNLWLESAELALEQAEKMDKKGISKQIINRILEPYQYYQVLVTATEWSNFFELRCPKYSIGVDKQIKSKKDAYQLYPNICENFTKFDWYKINYSQAEIHIQALAESMYDAMNESIPKKLEAGEWHLPFYDKAFNAFLKSDNNSLSQKDLLKVCTARAARLSYMTFDNEIDYNKDIELHDRLLESGHMSPFEHCARAMSDEEYSYFIKGYIENQGAERENLEDGYSEEIYIPKNTQGWCNNFRGFIQYRYLIENKIK